jgi:anti-anti-sigma factor
MAKPTVNISTASRASATAEPNSAFSFKLDPSGEIAFLNVTGDVDVSTAESLRKRLVKLVERAPKRLILRLKHVPYMDSAGVAVVLELIQAARATKTDLLVIEPSPAATRALGMVDIEALVNVYESVEECAECVAASAGMLRAHLYGPDELANAGNPPESN